MNFQIERLKRLPQRTKETWQGGLTKLPMWVQGRGQEPYRPWIAGWISIKTKLIHTTGPKTPQEKSFEMALSALADFACNEELAGYRPGKIEVKDSALAEHLGGLFEAGIKVEQRKKLFTFDQMIADMAEDIEGHPLVPNALEVKGVTVELMWAFADAAVQPGQFLVFTQFHRTYKIQPCRIKQGKVISGIVSLVKNYSCIRHRTVISGKFLEKTMKPSEHQRKLFGIITVAFIHIIK